MSTISVTVDQTDNAYMLVEWLKNIRFVLDVNVQIDKPRKGNVEAVQKALDSIKGMNLFADITDPVAYQRQLRDEWKRNEWD